MAPRIPIGSHGPWFFRRPLLLLPSQTQVHTHVIGTSGYGKSRWLASYYIALLEQGMAVTLIDPHATLADLILEMLVQRGYFTDESAFTRLLYLDLPGAAREGRYLPFNVLNVRDDEDPYDVTGYILEAMHRAWPDLSAGHAPAFDNIVRYGMKALISCNLPLSELGEFIMDRAYRGAVLAKESDARVVRFFNWFDSLPEREKATETASAMRRVSLLAYHPTLRFALASTANILDFRSIMDEGRSMIIKLDINDPGIRRLYGCLVTTAAERGAKSRSNARPGTALPAHYFMVDEFGQFVPQSGDGFSTMLSETRKYGLYGIFSHQFWQQTGPALQAGLGNVDLELIFHLAWDDAKLMAERLAQVNPLLVKHEVESEPAQERTHPAFYSIPEQIRGWTEELYKLPPRVAFAHLSRPRRRWWHMATRSVPPRLHKIRAPYVADPQLDPEIVARITREYRERYFHPPTFISAPVAPAPVRKKPI